MASVVVSRSCRRQDGRPFTLPRPFNWARLTANSHEKDWLLTLDSNDASDEPARNSRVSPLDYRAGRGSCRIVQKSEIVLVRMTCSGFALMPERQVRHLPDCSTRPIRTKVRGAVDFGRLCSS